MMRTRALVVFLTLLAMVCAVPRATAQPDSSPAPDAPMELVGPPKPDWIDFERVAELPETNAGRRVAWLLDALRGGSIEPVESHVTQRVIDEVGVEGFRDFVMQGRDAAGWMFPTHIIDSKEESLVLYLRSAVDGLRWVMRVSTTPEYPDRIDSLAVQPAMTPTIDRFRDWRELVEKFDATGYDYAISVWEIIDRDGEATIAPVAAINDDRPLNISGLSSLIVLGAAAEKISSGDGSWEDTIAIRDALKSVPQSPMHDAPEGTEHLVASLAGQMLQGDDTATDHLIDWIGADRVQNFAMGVRDDSPANEPFLATRHAYALKLAMLAPELRDAYVEADTTGRRAILDSLEIPDPSAMKMWIKPQAIDRIGHFASSRELAAVLLYLRNTAARPGMEALREILSANQQFRLDSGYWRSAAFTAGAEPGVLSIGIVGERMDGRWFVMSIVLNDTEKPLMPVDTSPLILGLIDLVERS